MDIFYINRNIDKERNQTFINNFQQHPSIKQIHRIEAIEVKNPPFLYNNELVELIKIRPKIEWFICIFLSHLKAILTFYHQTDLPFAIIMEDDADIIWNLINWKQLTNQKQWEIIKIYRTFRKKFVESNQLMTPYLKSNLNSGAVAYIINRNGISRHLNKIKQIGFSYPECKLNNIDPLLILFKNNRMTDTERLLFLWLFNPQMVYQLNIPIIGHTYYFVSTSLNNNDESKPKRQRLLGKEYYNYLVNLNTLPNHISKLNENLFTIEQYNQLTTHFLKIKQQTTNNKEKQKLINDIKPKINKIPIGYKRVIPISHYPKKTLLNKLLIKKPTINK